MKNQDTPENPLSNDTLSEMPSVCMTESMGETKYEKAFWQVYSAIMSDPEAKSNNIDNVADFAIRATDAGFKALENRND